MLPEGAGVDPAARRGTEETLYASEGDHPVNGLEAEATDRLRYVHDLCALIKKRTIAHLKKPSGERGVYRNHVDDSIHVGIWIGEGSEQWHQNLWCGRQILH